MEKELFDEIVVNLKNIISLSGYEIISKPNQFYGIICDYLVGEKYKTARIMLQKGIKTGIFESIINSSIVERELIVQKAKINLVNNELLSVDVAQEIIDIFLATLKNDKNLINSFEETSGEVPDFLKEASSENDIQEDEALEMSENDKHIKLFEEAVEAFKKKKYKDAYCGFYDLSVCGYLPSMNFLACMHFMGYYVPKDYVKAKEFLEKSANQNNHTSQLNLGIIYANGLGVTKNVLKAKEWYQKAINSGDNEAKFELAMLDYDSYWYETENKVLSLLLEASNAGVIKAQLFLGIKYIARVHNDVEGYKWIEKAALNGNVIAKCLAGELCYHGRGIDRNYEKAFNYFQQASNDNYAWAHYWLGYLYFTGNGTEKDYEKAITLLEKASENGINAANLKLGEIYYLNLPKKFMIGDKENVDKSLVFFEKYISNCDVKKTKFKNADKAYDYLMKKKLDYCSKHLDEVIRYGLSRSVSYYVSYEK